MTNEQRKALKAVRYATVEHVLAAKAGDVEDFELEELERSQAQAARRALQIGCDLDAVVAAQTTAGFAIAQGRIAEVA